MLFDEKERKNLFTKEFYESIKSFNPIKTIEIGRFVMQELKKFDKMAYVRFATIHKSIDDPKALEKELQTI